MAQSLAGTASMLTGLGSADNKVTTEQKLHSMEDLVEMKDRSGILDFRKNLTKLCRTE